MIHDSIYYYITDYLRKFCRRGVNFIVHDERLFIKHYRNPVLGISTTINEEITVFGYNFTIHYTLLSRLKLDEPKSILISARFCYRLLQDYFNQCDTGGSQFWMSTNNEISITKWMIEVGDGRHPRISTANNKVDSMHML